MYFNFSVYTKVIKDSEDWISCLCPLHSDSSPSFTGNKKTGRWKCFAGCGEGDFHELEELLKLPVKQVDISSQLLKPSEKNIDWDGYVLAKEYFYVNLKLEVRQKVRRYEHPDKPKRFSQHYRRADLVWRPGKSADSIMPYLFQHWHRSNETLLFVEGEKCADLLLSLGLQATTTIGGANGWKSKYAECFKDRTVLILPDNDESGIHYASAVHKEIKSECADVSILELPDLAQKGDVVDWLKTHSIDDLLKLIQEVKV